MEKILIIDDNNTILNILYELLDFHGYEVITASNGVEGIKLLDNEDDLGLVITDIRMPGADGNQVAEHLKSKEKTQNVPIIGLSGFLDDVKEELFDSIIIKPFDLNELISLVNSLISTDTGTAGSSS